jgi:hypothetical protein
MKLFQKHVLVLCGSRWCIKSMYPCRSAMIHIFIICFSVNVFSQSIGSDAPSVAKIDSKIEDLKMELLSCENKVRFMAESGKYNSQASESLNEVMKELRFRIEELESLKVSFGKSQNLKDAPSANNSRSASGKQSQNSTVAHPVILKRADFLTYPPDKQKQMLEMKSVYIIVD